MHPITRFAALAVLILLSGCAATQKLSDENRKKINVVKVNSDVKKAPVMYYLGPGAGPLFALGAVGGAIAAASSVEPGKALHDFAEKNGVFIEKIALQEIESALRASGKLKLSDSGAEAVINVLVFQFGFSIPHLLSSNLVPVVGIRCEIVNAAGEIIWSATDRVSTLSNLVQPMSLEEMRDNPKRIEDAWRKASQQIAANIVKDL